MNIQAYTTKELSIIYRVSRKTFNKWVDKYRSEIGLRVGHYYTPNQVILIRKHIGTPPAPQVKNIVSIN